jgi:hypothetical protein
MRLFCIDGDQLCPLRLTEVASTPSELRLQKSMLADGENSVLLTLESGARMTIYLSPTHARHAIVFLEEPELKRAITQITRGSLSSGDDNVQSD